MYYYVLPVSEVIKVIHKNDIIISLKCNFKMNYFSTAHMLLFIMCTPVVFPNSFWISLKITPHFLSGVD